MLTPAAVPWASVILALAMSYGAWTAWRWQRPGRMRFRNTVGGRLILWNLVAWAVVTWAGARDWTPDVFVAFCLVGSWLFLVAVPIHTIAPRVELPRCHSQPRRSPSTQESSTPLASTRT